MCFQFGILPSLGYSQFRAMIDPYFVSNPKAREFILPFLLVFYHFIYSIAPIFVPPPSHTYTINQKCCFNICVALKKAVFEERWNQEIK